MIVDCVSGHDKVDGIGGAGRNHVLANELRETWRGARQSVAGNRLTIVNQVESVRMANDGDVECQAGKQIVVG